MKILLLTGGVGTRLWPLSRTQLPKQFLTLPGSDHTLFQMAVLRSLALCGSEDLYVLTQTDYQFLITNQLEALNCSLPDGHLVFEPQMKNTLPAIYNGVREIRKQGDDLVAVFASDHLVRDLDAFAAGIRAAMPLADEFIVTFGVRPNKPETGYGYIQPGEAMGPGYRVQQFHEKPDAGTAAAYIRAGYLWNSGLFLFSSRLFCEEVARHAPEVTAAFDGTTVQEAFERTPSVSIDYGLMEKTDQTAVVPLNSDWDDLGSFASFYGVWAREADAFGNIAPEGTIPVDASGNLVIAGSAKTVALVGVDSLVVVDQPDALLISGRGAAQKVKTVVEVLNGRDDVRAQHQTTEYRPWGSFTVLEETAHYKLKRLVVLPGKRLSDQLHHRRSESWVVVRGTALITLDGETRELHSGDHVSIGIKQRHRVKNTGNDLLEIIETQTGTYFGEDDIVRFEDDYGRAKPR